MRARCLASAVLLSAVATVGAACGAASPGPGERTSLADALESTLGQESLGMRLSVTGTTEDVGAFFGDDYSSDEENARNARILLDSAITAVFEQDGDAAMDLRLGGIDRAAELRASGTTMYLRADVPAIAALWGAGRSDLDTFIVPMREMGLDDLADAALAGGWVSADLEPLESFMQGMGMGEAGFGFGDLSKMQAQSEKLVAALPEAFEKAVVSEFVATDDRGHHYRLSISTRDAFEAFMPLMSELNGDLIPATEVELMRSELPDETIVGDAWVSGGRLASLEFDMTQFEPSAGPVRLRLDLPADPAGVSMPSDSTEVDLVELFGSLMGTARGGDDSSEAGPSAGYSYEHDSDADLWEDTGDDYGQPGED